MSLVIGVSVVAVTPVGYCNGCSRVPLYFRLLPELVVSCIVVLSSVGAEWQAYASLGLIRLEPS